MADVLIKASVGIRLSNWTSSLTDPTGTGPLNNDEYLGPIYDSDAANYAGLQILKITKPTDVSITGIDPMIETFTTTEDPYEYDIEIRQNGGISFEIYDTIDTTNGTASMGLLWGSTFMPRGSTKSAAGAATYDAFADSNGGTAATDLVGYTAIVEWKINASLFKYIKLANCKIRAVPSPSPQKATKLRVDVSDARIVTIGSGVSSLLVAS